MRSRVVVAVTYLAFDALGNLPLLVETTPPTSPSISNERTRRIASSMSKYDNYYAEVEEFLNKTRLGIEDGVLVSYNSRGEAYKSTAYTYDDFLVALRTMSLFGAGGGSDDDNENDDPILFYVGQTDSGGLAHGLVNIAAFLAHAMVTSIKYDVCDEFNVDSTDAMKYAISNSCGQWGRSYMDEACVGDDSYMTCEIDADMTALAATYPFRSDLPPRFECRPRVNATDFTGYWDTKLGRLSETYPFANRAGAIHNEGCCWWGRGVLFTRGTCKFGRLNHFLAIRAQEEEFSTSRLVDFCANPEIVCEGKHTMDLRWRVGYFDWADAVQTYRNAMEGWDYMRELRNLIETDFVDVDSFIDVVGMALPFGCLESTCFAVEEEAKQERRRNFAYILFNVFNVPLLVKTTYSDSPSMQLSLQQTLNLSKTPTQQPIPYNICDGQSSTLIPINGCKDYVKCYNGNQVSQLSCSEGFLFDVGTGQCLWADSVDGCRVSPLNPVPDSTPKPSIPSNPHPESAQTSRPNTALSYHVYILCKEVSSGYVPFNGCKEYIRCENGRPVAREVCADGLLYDSAISQCNYADSVSVCDVPTTVPTSKPIEFPTSLPSEKIFPLSPRPTFATPRPMESLATVEPSNVVLSNLPTYSLMSPDLPATPLILTPSEANGDQPNQAQLPGDLILLEGNGAEKSWCLFAYALGIAALNLLV